MRWRTGRPDGSSLAELQDRYQQACDSNDYVAQLALLETITAAYPQVSWGWYDLGLRYKWMRDWQRSRDYNLRALELLDNPVQQPAAWNLGIAATALRDWTTARRAWTAFGVTLPPAPDGDPIDADFGPTPIRLNPRPRFGELPFTLDGVSRSSEVVWAARLCPARAKILSVPTPESGHRFADVVLHDGDPVGKRRLGDSEHSVYNEILLFERGPWATLTVVIDQAAPPDLDVLQERFDERGFAVENWTDGFQIFCQACSEGTPGEQQHNHPPRSTPSAATTTLGIAAPLDEADRILDAWLAPLGLRRGPVLLA